jgi:hypothetical protein
MAEDKVDPPAAEDDPWGAALAEQTQAEEAAQKTSIGENGAVTAKTADATIFRDLSWGVPRSPSRTCCNWRKARWWSSTAWPVNQWMYWSTAA